MTTNERKRDLAERKLHEFLLLKAYVQCIEAGEQPTVGKLTQTVNARLAELNADWRRANG